MNLRQLSLCNYRNYENASFQFEPSSIYCFIGKNAQGKTNLVEAIYYLSHLRSFRTNQVKSLIQKEKDFFGLKQ